jgi:hypothetical protein
MYINRQRIMPIHKRENGKCEHPSYMCNNIIRPSEFGHYAFLLYGCIYYPVSTFETL